MPTGGHVTKAQGLWEEEVAAWEQEPPAPGGWEEPCAGPCLSPPGVSRGCRGCSEHQPLFRSCTPRGLEPCYPCSLSGLCRGLPARQASPRSRLPPSVRPQQAASSHPRSCSSGALQVLGAVPASPQGVLGAPARHANQRRLQSACVWVCKVAGLAYSGSTCAAPTALVLLGRTPCETLELGCRTCSLQARGLPVPRLRQQSLPHAP